jgi:hypothetical protein
MRAAVLLLSLLLASNVWADIGSVTELTGSALIKRGKDTITVTKGTLVQMNDKVETKNGKVKIVFKDNTNVSVTESSALIIDDFVYDPKSGAGKLNLKAAAGTVRYVSGNIAHNNPNAVNIKTPTAAIAVRGTDFVMAVAETGSSMIMLMPTCEIEQNINLKGLTCGSGAIDVETPAGIVKLNRPYQATLVETLNGAPSPAVIVALNGMAIGNNLMISPPRTTTGLNVIQAARAAAEKTGDAKKDDKKDRKDGEDKEDKEKEHERQVAGKEEKGSNRSYKQGRSANEGDENLENATKVGLDVQSNKDALANDVASVSETENPYVKKLWKDKSETQQIGWQYESLSPNSRNYANVVLPMSTQIQVVVTQDMQTNSWSFAANGGKPQGQIVINQSFR